MWHIFPALFLTLPLAAQVAAPKAPASPSTPATAARPAAAPNAKAAEIVVKVQNYYRTINKLEAKFKQTYTRTVFGTKSSSEGKLYLAKPGKMRWDYKTPDVKFFISDGKVLWTYEKANQQAFRHDLKDQLLPVAVSFLFGQGELSKDFEATLDPGKYGQKTDIVLKLVPRKPTAQYKHLWLVVDPTDSHVKESIIREASDSLNHFKYWELRLNADTHFEDKHFVFVPPKGVKVIDPAKDGPR